MITPLNLALWAANPGLMAMPAPIGIMSRRGGYGGASDPGGEGPWWFWALIVWFIAGLVCGLLCIVSFVPIIVFGLVSAAAALGVCVAAIANWGRQDP